MKFSHLLTATAFSAVISAQAMAADVSVRAGVGFSGYTLDAELDSVSISSDMTVANVGLTTGFGNSYLDISYQTAIDAEHDLYQDFGYSAAPFERTDLAITYGISISESLTVFAGWKSGESVIKLPNEVLAFNTFTKNTFEASGLFVGLAARFAQSDSGSFSVNGAVAALDGNWSNDNTNPANAFNIDAETTFGFSVGAAYNLYVGEAGTLIFALANQNYSFDFGDVYGIGENYIIDENMTNLTMSYSQAF